MGDIRAWKGRRPHQILFSGFTDSAIVISRKNNFGVSQVGLFKDFGDLLTEVDSYDLTPEEKYTIFRPEFVGVVVSRIEETLKNAS